MKQIVRDKLAELIREAMLDNGVSEYGVDPSVNDILDELDQNFQVGRSPVQRNGDPYRSTVWSVRNTDQLMLCVDLAAGPFADDDVIHTTIPCGVPNLDLLAKHVLGNMRMARAMPRAQWDRIHRFEGEVDRGWLPANLTERCDLASNTLFLDSF